jgi:hypothetical protein
MAGRSAPGDFERRLLVSCEQTLERLALDQRYFARPTQRLFAEVRGYFPPQRQLAVFTVIDARMAQALAFLRQESARGSTNLLRCRATTRRGKVCQRNPLPRSRYCPSHKHLDLKGSAQAA